MQASTSTTRERDALLDDLEHLWGLWDELLGSLTPEDWSRKHGKDWVMADVPYHLAYFDRDLIANAIERGSDVPAGEQQRIRTMRELDAWNAEKFAQRPAGQTVEQALEQMRAAREAVRRAVAGLSDADLDRQVWMPLLGGSWITVRTALKMCRLHTWSELIQIRLRLKRTGPPPRPAITHAALDMYTRFFQFMLNREQAAKTPFTAVMEYTGPGGGAWTIQVADGACEVREGRTDRADLVMTQAPETFVKTLNNMHNPMVAMLTRQIKVKGMRKMGTFAKLFPPPTPDTVMEAPVVAHG